MENSTLKIAIIGGGPSALFMFKRLVESNNSNFEVHIFEKKAQLGSGMPYSSEGATDEHVTNVSENEIPEIVTPISEWMTTIPENFLNRFGITLENFNEYKVMPRLFFGKYLEDQFKLLLKKASAVGLKTVVHYNTSIVDVVQNAGTQKVSVLSETEHYLDFDIAVLCMGHIWPKEKEGIIPNYFESPYPPTKLCQKLNHPVALRGSSLTAIDAIKTLSRANGTFFRSKKGILKYKVHPDSSDFKIVMHSRAGMLPAVRFHLQDSHLTHNKVLSKEELSAYMKEHEGTVSLDYIFEKDFKALFLETDPAFFDKIKDFTLEEFVEEMMQTREQVDAFQLLKGEYKEAAKSIKTKKSVYWKELLAVLSFALNYPAKHLPAEDLLRLQKVLLPLISIIIAFVPQRSCDELLAMHRSGNLDLVAVGEDNSVIAVETGGANISYTSDDGCKHSTFYATFIDCIGQRQLKYEEFPFKSLLHDAVVSPAMVKFKCSALGESMRTHAKDTVIRSTDTSYYLKVNGIAINDNFQVLDATGSFNSSLYMMAVPYMGGFNPDYSGLDFCEEASQTISAAIHQFVS